MTICCNSPLPTLDTIMAGFIPKLTFPPMFSPVPALPVLPVLPNPIYASIKAPNLELITIANELQSFQMQTTQMAMITPMLNYVGGALSSFLPKIPGTNLSLVDLMAPGSSAAVFAAIKSALQAGFVFPGVPSPLFPSLNIPDIEIMHTVQLIVSNYMQMVTTSIIGLVKQVTDKLKIGAMPTPPAIPDPNLVISMATDVIANKKAELQALGQRVTSTALNIPALLAGLSFPGLPPLPALPCPLIPSFSIPSIEAEQVLTSLFNSLTTGVLAPVMNFINSTLKNFLSFSFPLICIPL